MRGTIRKSGQQQDFLLTIYFLAPFSWATVGSDFIPLPKATAPAGRTPKATITWVPVTASPRSQLWLMDDALSYCPDEDASSPSTKSLVYRVCLFLDLSAFTHFKYSICFLWEPDKKHLI